jgi:hypothetical protein
MGLRARERRFRRIFHLLALSPVAALAAAQACSSGDHTTPPDEAGADAPEGSSFVPPGFAPVDATPEAFPWCDAGAPYSIATNQNCRYFTHVPCGVPDSVAVGIYGDLSTCYIFCPDPASTTLRCYLYDGSVRVDPLPDGGFNDGGGDAIGPPVPEGGVAVECETCLGGGRRPGGYRAPRCAPRKGGAVARHLTSLADLEAASVVAFETMAADLAHHGAPASLVRAARRSARDERRHAALMRRAASRFGAGRLRDRAHASPRGPRSLLAIALENAVEGCVRETFGALVATHQARRATDPLLASLFRAIADDETRHAALSWELARWAEARLSPSERRRVARARQRAVVELRAELASQRPDAERAPLGLPMGRSAVALLDAMVATIEAAA